MNLLDSLQIPNRRIQYGVILAEKPDSPVARLAEQAPHDCRCMVMVDTKNFVPRGRGTRPIAKTIP
jgi:hypothetical protein